MSYLMVVLGLGAAAAFGYGSPSACADSPTWSDYALLDFAPSGFALPTDDASPILNASATAITDDFDLASQAMAGGTANPLVSAADDFSSALNALLDGVSPAPSDPGAEVGFSGSPFTPRWTSRLRAANREAVREFSRDRHHVANKWAHQRQPTFVAHIAGRSHGDRDQRGRNAGL